MKRRIVLASQSPRRREILAAAGIAFEVRLRPVAEVRASGESAADYVRRLSREKAFAVACAEEEIVLGADTVVVAQGEVLEKPADALDARRMLELLSGKQHEVLTGICLRTAADAKVDVATSTVQFSLLTPEEIQDYIATGEPFDKAGAYAIQGLASKFIERVDGCYSNVVGLPISLVYRHLKKLEVSTSGD